MNEIQETMTYLQDADRTIKQTHNLVKLINKGSSDEDELKSEAISNLKWIEKDLEKVRQYLYPEKYAVIH